MSKLEKAIKIALDAHAGQVDRVGQPYVLHVLRVMLAGCDEDAMIVGVLHDVIEDTTHTLEDLHKAGFGPRVIEAVDALTRRDDETYGAFIERASHNPLAARVKLADLRDNMDITRLGDLNDEDAARLQRYLKAWHKLNGSQ